jgi:LmbE family N-acetylglucosaminyl deacetylase
MRAERMSVRSREVELLGVFAHPDDESFECAGLFQRAHTLGLRTGLICATPGQAGRISNRRLATPQTLARVRVQELQRACHILGIAEVQVLDYPDGGLAQADRGAVLARLVAQIRRLRPRVVVTFDAKGSYGHLDHIAIHQLTVAACALAGDESYTATPLPPHAPEHLYAVVPSQRGLRAMEEALARRGGSFQPGGDAATIPVAEMGVPDAEIALSLTLTDTEYGVKRQAIAAHATQAFADSPVVTLPPEVLRPWIGVEHYQHLASAVSQPQSIHRLADLVSRLHAA